MTYTIIEIKTEIDIPQTPRHYLFEILPKI